MNERRTVKPYRPPVGGNIVAAPSSPMEPDRPALPAPPDGTAKPVPIRLYRRQIDRLDALRRSLAPGVLLSRSAAIRWLIDHWKG